MAGGLRGFLGGRGGGLVGGGLAGGGLAGGEEEGGGGVGRGGVQVVCVERYKRQRGFCIRLHKVLLGFPPPPPLCQQQGRPGRLGSGLRRTPCNLLHISPGASLANEVGAFQKVRTKGGNTFGQGGRREVLPFWAGKHNKRGFRFHLPSFAFSVTAPPPYTTQNPTRNPAHCTSFSSRPLRPQSSEL